MAEGSYLKNLKDPDRFQWTLNKMSESHPQFVTDLQNAIDRGEEGLISEDTLYKYYEQERSAWEDVWDFLDAVPNAISTALYESNPEFYEAQRESFGKPEELGMVGLGAGLAGLIGTTSALTPKLTPVTAALSGAGLLTSAGIGAAVAGGDLGVPKLDRLDDAASAFLKSFTADPWDLKTFHDLMPQSPNMASFLNLASPDPTFDAAVPAVGSRILRATKGRKAEQVVKNAEGLGPEEAKYLEEHPLREDQITRYKEGRSLLQEYMAIEKSGKDMTLLSKEDFITDLNRYRTKVDAGKDPVSRTKRSKIIRKYADLYHKDVAKEEVDVAYLLGKRLPLRPLDTEDFSLYKQTGDAGGLSRQLLDVKRYTDAVFGPASAFAKKFVDPVLDGVWKALSVASTKRKEFEDLARRAGVRKLSISSAGKAIRLPAQKEGEAINEKMYNAIESGDLSGLDDAQKEFYYYINNFYEEALFEANKVLRSLGKKEIGTSYIKTIDGKEVRQPGNYLPRIWALSYFDEIWDGLRNIPDEVLGKIDEVVGDAKTAEAVGEGLENLTGRYQQEKWMGGRWLPFSAFAQRRMGIKDDYLKDVIETFDSYNMTIQRIKHVSSPAETAFRAVDQLTAAHMISPTANDYYKSWLSSGAMNKRAPIDKILFPDKRPLGFRMIEGLVHNMSRNLLAGSLQFFMTNIASFPQYVAMAGVRDTTKALWRSRGELIRGLPTMMRGLGATANEAGESFARANSKVLQMREFTGYENMGREIMKGSNVLTAWEKIIESADHFNVAWGFNTGYIKAKKMGLADAEAIKYADEIAQRTQAVYDRAFISPILRNRVIQTAVPFQTFTTNLYQWFTRDIARGGLPMKGKEGVFEALSPFEKMGMAIRFLGTAYAINLSYEAIGLRAPWDLKSVIPFAPAVASITGEAIDEPYGAKTLQLTFLDPVKKVWQGVMAENYDLMDPEFRKLIEGALLLQPYGFGLQANRTLTGLFDVMEGGSTVPTGRGTTRYGYLDNQDKALSLLLGPRKTGAYKDIRGEFSPQPSRFQTIQDIIFPKDFPPWQGEE